MTATSEDLGGAGEVADAPYASWQLLAKSFARRLGAAGTGRDWGCDLSTDTDPERCLVRVG
jgi:hypothetical protein